MVYNNALKVIIVLTACYALFWLFDWRAGTSILSSLQQIGNYPLLNLSGIYITSLSIVEFLVLASIFLWVSKWTRECCYRWVFRDARDAGIRNSLSVFTQYAVILIGGFLTLRVLGLDFSGMSMIVGGLAVGLGFGLRDFASNVVGGLMLLIERPVREGDLITLGGYEGQVSHIGIRSMRVCSWDNTEVLIPNAEDKCEKLVSLQIATLQFLIIGNVSFIFRLSKATHFSLNFVLYNSVKIFCSSSFLPVAKKNLHFLKVSNFSITFKKVFEGILFVGPEPPIPNKILSSLLLSIRGSNEVLGSIVR